MGKERKQLMTNCPSPLQTVDFMEILSCWESKNEASVPLQKMVGITKSHLNKEDRISVKTE